MRKIINVILFFIEIVLLAGAFALNFLTSKKMGVLRYVVNKNNAWQKEYPIEAIKYMFAAVLIVFIVIAAIKLIRSPKRIILFAVIVVYAAIGVFILSASPMLLKAYYFMVVILMFTALIQTVNILILPDNTNLKIKHRI